MGPYRLLIVAVFAMAIGGGCIARPPRTVVPGTATTGSVVGASGLYTLTPPATGWRQLPVGTLAKDTDLELRDQTEQRFVLVYTKSDPQGTIDQTVAWRFTRMFDNSLAGDRAFSERRYFLDDATLVPASLARYEAPGKSGRQIFLVLTVLTEQGVVEAIGRVGALGAPEDEVRALLNTLRPNPPRAVTP